MAGNLNKSIKNSITLEKVAFKILIEAYTIALSKKQYDLDWTEEQFSQYLVSIMEKSNIRTQHQLCIRQERKLHDNTYLPVGINNPKNLPRIDISIASWTFKVNTEQEFFFEAKNLCEKNWKKKNGARVSSKYYLDRYISTGIENFRIGRYYNGAIVGYILQGQIYMILKELKNRLYTDKNTVRSIKKINYVNNFQNIYHSKHRISSNTLEIKHIFLKL